MIEQFSRKKDGNTSSKQREREKKRGKKPVNPFCKGFQSCRAAGLPDGTPIFLPKIRI
jgi:hypothetical protein